MASTEKEFRIRTSNRKFQYFDEEKESTWNGPFVFIQAADTQFGMIDSYLEHKEDPKWDKEIALTRKAVEAANKMKPIPKFFVVCGDLVDAFPATDPDRRKLQEKDFKAVFSELNPSIPLVCVCGNHDVGNTPTKETVARYRSTFGDDYFSFWVGGVFFIVLNSQYYMDPSEVEELAAEHQDWLDSILPLAKKATHTVIFQHVPWFYDCPDALNDSYFYIELSTTKTMMEKFQAAGIQYVFCGHRHANGGGFIGNVEVVVTTAIGAQLGSDNHGLRVVKVFKESIQHDFYELDDIPETVYDVAIEK